MSKSISRVWVLVALALAVVSAGCVQDVGDAGRENAVAQLLPSPTSTDTPTEFPSTDTPTPSPEPSPQDVLADFAADTPTATPSPSPEVVAQVSTTDPFLLTATQLYLNATATIEFSITQTAAALGIGSTPTDFPTFTYTPSPTLEGSQGGSVVAPGSTCIHIVSAGENLFRLSLRYGVSVNELAAASGILNPNLIVVGQNIVIPGCGTTGVFPPPTPMGTFSGQDAGSGGVVTRPGTVHIVQQYETLFQLSLRYGVSVNSIAAANGISNINRITMGQELVIPSN